MLRKPGFWLTVLWLLLLLGFAVSGRLAPLQSGDSEQLLHVATHSFTEYLAAPHLHIIPYGYPLFLRAFDETLTRLPLCQVALHGLAVWLFYRGLCGLLELPWLAGAMAATLLFSNTILEYGRRVMSDAPASSLAIATVAALLFLVRDPRRPLPWLGVTLGVFATCQVRAAYLFLLPLTPLLGVLLMALALPRADWVRYRLRVGLALLALCVVPSLAYAGVCRWLGGAGAGTAMGPSSFYVIATQFLTEDVLPELPPEVRPLARLILDRQKELDQGRFPQALLDPFRSIYPNLTGDADAPGQPVRTSGRDYDPKAIRTLRDLTDALATAEPEPGAFAAFRDLALRLQQQTDRHVLMYLVLADTSSAESAYAGQTLPLALAVIRARPRAYLGHLATMFLTGLLVAALNSFVQVTLLAGLLLLLLVWHVRFLFRGPGAPADPASPALLRALHLMLLLGISFAVAKTVVVIVGSIPVPRYIDAAGVFLPGVTMSALVLFARYVHAARRGGGRP